MAQNHNKSTTLIKLLESEATGGILLLLATAMAMYLANTAAYSADYFHFLHHDYTVFAITKDVHHWINDGIMTIFFFTIGLEVKREWCDENGHLNEKPKRVLPIFAALGGVIVPATIFAFIAHAVVGALDGWAIPAATDIAFALGVLMLVGRNKVPLSVKVFLLAIAVIDDLMAVSIIALFYTNEIQVSWLLGAVGFLFPLWIMNRMNSANLLAYILWGTGLWVCVLNSGIHATVAGVLAAMMIPATAKLGNDWSLLKTAEHWLSPMNAWLVMPIFALANAGVNLEGVNFASLLEPVTLGIALGLALGKPIAIIGVTLFMIYVCKTKIPSDMTIRHVIGVGLLAGIGFTMSIFITDLAYVDPAFAVQAKLGILMASFGMGLMGFLWFKFACPDVVSKNAGITSYKNQQVQTLDINHVQQPSIEVDVCSHGAMSSTCLECMQEMGLSQQNTQET